MKLLDLFCGAGGCAMGYSWAGFTDITGVDIKPMPRYPFRFVLGDALEYLARLIETGEIEEYDLIHASPPCQAYSVTQAIHGRDYPDLLEPTRKLLIASGRPYVIENVEGAPLHSPLTLCGTMFDLLVLRHRLFESNPPVWFAPAMCHHHRRVVKVGYLPNRERHFAAVAGHFSDVEFAREAMGISWMTRDELAQAIPPAYTCYLGTQMLRQLAPAGVLR